MEFKDEQVIYSSEKCKITKGEYNGKQCIKKTGSFSREAVNAIARINSPYIPHIYEIGDDYIISEYADGIDLSNGKISPRNVLDIALELCSVLGELHKNSIIHRDIKPSNIILGSDGHIKLIDFDAARIKKATVDKDTVFIGTDGFAPPEQFGFAQTDERSDIYAFGTTIKLLLGENYTHSPYKRVIEKCIRFNPEQRYRSVNSVKSALVRSRYLWFAVPAAAILGLTVVISVIVVLSASSGTFSDIASLPENSTVEDLSTSKSENSVQNDIPESSTQDDLSTLNPESSIKENISSSKPENSVQDETSFFDPENSTQAQNTSSSDTISNPSTPDSTEYFAENREMTWDMLALPDDFPKLADAVTDYSVSVVEHTEGNKISKLQYIISWQKMNDAEFDEIKEKFKSWLGVTDDGVFSEDDITEKYDFATDIYEISLQKIYGQRLLSHIFGDSEDYFQGYISIEVHGDDLRLPIFDCAFADPSAEELGNRPLRWEDTVLNGKIPKLSDNVTEVKESPNGGYTIIWDEISIGELGCVLREIMDWLKTTQCRQNFIHERQMLWSFSGDEDVIFVTVDYDLGNIVLLNDPRLRVSISLQ